VAINEKCRHYPNKITNKTKDESNRQMTELLTEENINLVTVHTKMIRRWQFTGTMLLRSVYLSPKKQNGLQAI
jgi:hypothetical protein